MEITSTSFYFSYLIKLGITGELIHDLLEFKRLWRVNLETFSKKTSRDEDEDILVSIIIPTKNEERTLSKLLKSLSYSWYRNIEVIVADYESRDRTREVAKRYKAKVVNIDKPGVGYATFVATHYAKGDIIIRTDADTVFPPHIVLNTVKAFKNNTRVMVYHVGHFYYDGDIFDNLMAFLYDKYWRKPWNTTGHFIAFRKEIIKKVNFNPYLKYDDDWDFGKRMKEAYGDQVFLFKRYDTVFTSSRRIRKTSRLKYIFGIRIR